MSNLLALTERNTLGYTFYDPLNRWQQADSERRADEWWQLEEFGCIKRIPNTGHELTPEEATEHRAKCEREAEQMHRRMQKLRVARGEFEGLEEYYTRMGYKGIVIPVRCKRCGDPVKDDTEPCGKCLQEQAEVMSELHR